MNNNARTSFNSSEFSKLPPLRRSPMKLYQRKGDDHSPDATNLILRPIREIPFCHNKPVPRLPGVDYINDGQSSTHHRFFHRGSQDSEAPIISYSKSFPSNSTKCFVQSPTNRNGDDSSLSSPGNRTSKYRSTPQRDECFHEYNPANSEIPEPLDVVLPASRPIGSPLCAHVHPFTVSSTFPFPHPSYTPSLLSSVQSEYPSTLSSRVETCSSQLRLLPTTIGPNVTSTPYLPPISSLRDPFISQCPPKLHFLFSAGKVAVPRLYSLSTYSPRQYLSSSWHMPLASDGLPSLPNPFSTESSRQRCSNACGSTGYHLAPMRSSSSRMLKTLSDPVPALAKIPKCQYAIPHTGYSHYLMRENETHPLQNANIVTMKCNEHRGTHLISSTHPHSTHQYSLGPSDSHPFGTNIKNSCSGRGLSYHDGCSQISVLGKFSIELNEHILSKEASLCRLNSQTERRFRSNGHGKPSYSIPDPMSNDSKSDANDDKIIFYGFPRNDDDANRCLLDTPGISDENRNLLKSALLQNLAKVRRAARGFLSEVEDVIGPEVSIRGKSLPRSEADKRLKRLVRRFCKSRKEIIRKFKGYVRNRKWIENIATRQRRGCLSHRQNNILRLWLFTNFDNPYPRTADKTHLMEKTKMNLTQINNWLINARSRVWKPTVESMSGESVRKEFFSRPAQKNEDVLVKDEDVLIKDEDVFEKEDGIVE